MKIKNYFYFIFTILSSCAFIACNSDNDKDEFPKTIKTQKLLVNGEEVSSSYFEVEKEDTVYVIDSDDILFNFIRKRNTPQEETPQPMPLPQSFETDVDYTKSSVLILGGSSGGIREMEASYIQESAQRHVLKVTIHLTGTEELVLWTYPVVVPKVGADVKIREEIEYINPKFD